MKRLSHFDKKGKACMVDVTGKSETMREAVATGFVRMRPQTVKLIKSNNIAKGDVLTVANVAGILAAKNAQSFIPMAHPLMISHCSLSFVFSANGIRIEAAVKVKAVTGVEMEALTAVSVAALTIYDMCKAVDRQMIIEDVCLVKKTGGRSGEYIKK